MERKYWVIILMLSFLVLGGCSTSSASKETDVVNAESELSGYKDELDDSYFKAKEDIMLCMIDGYYGEDIDCNVKSLTKELNNGVYAADQYKVESQGMLKLKDEISKQGELLSALLDNAKESEIHSESIDTGVDAEVSEDEQSAFIAKYTELIDKHYALVEEINESNKIIDSLLD